MLESFTELTLAEKQECKPLKTVEQVFEWKADESDWSKRVCKLVPRAFYCYEGCNFKCHKTFRKPLKVVNSGAPKTLLCHDMKGGYLDDRFVEGVSYQYQYLFYHWSVVDTFVYFSHYFVTVPPLMWINAAHKNGVRVLGTLITEGDGGKKICEEILSDSNTLLRFVDQLVAICRHYRFDGYLLNIENEIDVSLLPRLITLVRELKQRTEAFGGRVLWYDSVSLVNGKLRWQNELNCHNKAAFNVCDGIFLNYGWNETSLQNSVANAGCRQCDVYVGVDVFGRGCFGGGGFNTDMAMRVLRSFGLSAAIFGPGWTHETQADDSSFFVVERKFWSKLWPYLFVHVCNYIPFKTTFNRGIRVDPDDSSTTEVAEKKVLRYDLSAQSYQLSIPSCPGVVSTEDPCIDYSDGFSESSYIVLRKNKRETEVHRLLLCDFSCSHRRPLSFTISARSVGRVFVPFDVILVVENDDNNFSVLLRVSGIAGVTFVERSGENFDFSHSMSLSVQINANKLVEFSGDGNSWISNKFVLNFDGRITEMSAQVEESVIINSLALDYEKVI